MATGSSERGLTIGVIGGLGSSENILRTKTEHLRASGREVVCFSGDWASNESAKDKITRAKKFVDSLGKSVLVGESLGGLLALVAGFNSSNVEGISTVVAPLQKPKRMSPVLWTYTRLHPAILDVRDAYYKEVDPKVKESKLPLLHYLGTKDFRIKPRLSFMRGTEGKKHVLYEEIETPSIRKRNGLSAHSYTITKALRHDLFLQFIEDPSRLARLATAA